MGRRLVGLGPALVAVVLAAQASGAPASTDAAMKEYDAKLVQELAAIAPGSVSVLEEANRARAAKNHARAAELYGQVLAAAPEFSHARRRLCNAKLALGQREEALVSCREAARDGKAPNLSALAGALIDREGGRTPTAEEATEARALAEQATRADTSDFYAWAVLCQVGAAQRDDAALSRCTAEVERTGPPDMLAQVLVLRANLLIDSEPRGRSSSVEARRLAETAARLAPEAPGPQGLLCRIATTANDIPLLGQCSSRLLRLAPDEVGTHVYATLAASIDGRHAEARSHLERAKALGLEAEVYDELSSSLEQRRPFYDGWLGPAGWTLGAWGAGLVALVLAGLGLSRAALAAARELPSERSGRAVGMSASLRRAYATVLWLCCAFYYVSLPLVAVVVVGTGAGMVYLSLVIGHIPIKLLVIAAILVFVTLASMLKSLTIKPKDADPGPKLDLAAHPQLDAVIRQVADKVGTRPVDTVFMTPGTDVAVFERGGVLTQLRGRAERCLILGAGVLEGMKLIELKAVLAHEYGHFSNRDTAGGGFALAVRRSLLTMAMGLAEGGAATWYNPAWLFVSNFYKVFLRISQGASRLQEVLADRWATFAYGSEAFVRGLRHVIAQSVRFDAHVNATLGDVLERERPLANLYRHEPEKKPKKKAVRQAIEEVLAAEPSPYDSHPAPRDRIAWVEALGAPGPDGEDGEVDAWSLFENREELEEQMTAEVRARVHDAHGIVVKPA